MTLTIDWRTKGNGFWVSFNLRMPHANTHELLLTSQSSMKELSKAIGASIPNETLPLPDDLLEIIQAYLDKHNPIEDSDSQRLQDELLGIYQKDVKDVPSRYPIFIAILRQLRPTIASSGRLLQWWETLVVPVLDNLTGEKGLAAQTRGILLDILAYDTDAGEESEEAVASAIFSGKLLETWLKKSTLESAEKEAREKFLEEQIQLVLMDFGRKRPKVLTTIPFSITYLSILGPPKNHR